MRGGLHVAREGDPAYRRILAALHDHGSQIEEQREGDALAQCPAHNDGRPSLHVTDGDDRALVYCFAGCDTEAVLGAIGMTRDDLFNAEVTNYSYRDAAGAVSRTVTRRPGKRISQSGQTKGEALLYRLPEVIEGVKAGVPILLVEGEPDVHAWVRRGKVATTAPAGARNFDKADLTPLAGAQVIAVVDRDESGDAWALLVQEGLRGIAESLTFCRAKVGKDSSDHIAAGLGMEDLEPYSVPNPLLAGIRTGDWLDTQEFPDLAWVVPDLIPEGFGIVAGPPKAGKSFLILSLALSVACGQRALGRLGLVKPKPVLYLALEDGDRRLQERARTLLMGEPIPAIFEYVTEVPMGQAFLLIQAWLAQHQGRNPMVIIDTLGKVMPPKRGNEDQYQRDYRIGSAVKSLAQPGVAILVVHHTRKADSSDWMESTSGTNGLTGAADWTMNLSRARNSAHGVIRVAGRDVIEGEYAVVFNRGCWYLDGATLEQAASNAQDMEIRRRASRTTRVEVEVTPETEEGVVTCLRHGLPFAPDIGCPMCRME